MSVYDVSIPPLLRGLTTLTNILTIATEYATSRSITTRDLSAARLIADQLPLSFQVHNATRAAKIAVERLTGKTIEPYAGDLAGADFPELIARIEDARALVKGVVKGEVDGRAGEKITIPVGRDTLAELSVKEAILSQSIPNFFFHLVTAFSILRANGVPIGKAAYIGVFISGQE